MNSTSLSRRSFLQTVGAGAAAAHLGCGASEPEAPGRPNILMIISDDMGYSDLGCYGGELKTPNLDRLGYGGMRFTRYYTNNMCVPTRGALMTGIQSDMALQQGRVRQDAVTVPEALKQAGYGTYMAGKWHLAKEVDDFDSLPCQRGFDHFYGQIIGAASFFAPYSLMRDNEPCPEDYASPDWYYTDAISDAAVSYVQEAGEKDEPFFLYLSYTAAHWPLHAFDKDIEPYNGKYAMGWDKLREQRHARMKELDVVNPAWELSPRNPEVPAWEDEPHKAWQERRMEVYAAQVDVMDRGIGRVLDELERQGKLENTLVCFQIDNGGCHVEYTTDRKGNNLPDKTRDGRPMRPGNVPEIMPGPEDTYQSYGYGWANASNTPFRLYKQFDHEGGILVPLIAHWPGEIEAKSMTNQVAHVIDLAPTFLEAASIDKPDQRGDAPAQPFDGASLLGVFRGGTRQAHETMYWQWNHGRAVRHGHWKLVARDEEPWELYDLEADGTELHNLVQDMPDKASELEQLWNQWKARSQSDS